MEADFRILTRPSLFFVTVIGLALSQPVQAQNATSTDNSQDQPEANPPESKPDQTPVEPNSGATSFSNLCGNGQGKPDGTPRAKRKGIFGLADRMAAATRQIPLIGDFMVDSANSLSQSIACRLYPEEQKQAAEATQEAVRSEEIGTTVSWESTVRDNVRGSSTVEAKSALEDGTPCMTIADIVIIDGEEVRVSKQMCRLAGASEYTIMPA